MEVIYEKVDYNWQESFNIQKYSRPNFESPWHFHPEHEIVLILKGHGKRFVGDSIEDFCEGDLVLIKGKTPHFWMSDTVFYKNDSSLKCESIYIQFLDTVFPENFPEIANYKNLAKAIKKSERGIEILGKDKKIIAEKIIKLYGSKGIDRIVGLYKILDYIGKTSNYNSLGSVSFTNLIASTESKVTSLVHQFLIENFKQKITLNEIASVANYSPAAFCRYFKGLHNRSVFEYLNEIRISYACKLLINKELSVTQIAYESGYNSISHFNRQFRKIMVVSPNQYRSKFNAGDLYF